LKKKNTGVSTFGEIPTQVGPEHLDELLKHALEIVPKHAVESTPIFLMATAGMRLLPDLQQKALLNEICSYARTTTKFLLPDCDLHIQVIRGETEGLYGWIAANYLLGGFDRPEDHAHGKGHHTYGFLDMGGASAQIAFAPNATEAEKHANDLNLLRMRTVNGDSKEYKVFVTTWLGFGMHQARKRYVQALLDASGTHDAKELPDPCLPVGLKVTTDGDVLSPDSDVVNSKDPPLIGTGRFRECLHQVFPLLEKDAPCVDEPCLLHGVHVPAIDFDVNHFIGVSEYWHTTHEVFEMGHRDKAYDFNTYQQRVKDFCSQDWDTISDGVEHHKWGAKVGEKVALEVCFKASWLINMLHNGIGIPRIGLDSTAKASYNGTKQVIQYAEEKGFLAPFQAVDKIDDIEVSWTLGKMVLYAASQIPAPNGSLPVGFGSNVAGIPPDFQYAGSAYTPLPDNHPDEADDWHDQLFSSDSPRRIPGFLLFILILAILVFLLYGRDRRTRLWRRLCAIFSRRPGSPKKGGPRNKFLGSKLFAAARGSGPAYERVMEAGEAAAFDLAPLESGDDNEHSDSSASSERSGASSRVGRSSGWATPRLKVGFEHGAQGYFDGGTTAGVGLGLGVGNAMDRSGLVVRTESRERLAPVGIVGGGRRSRNGSPTRGRSPLINVEVED
jgi:Golgi nucleoside diphosphatase